MATAQQPRAKGKTVAVIIRANPSDGTPAAPKKINVDIEPMPGAALQTYRRRIRSGRAGRVRQGGRQAGVWGTRLR
jgi:hypothetical protein